MRYRRMWLDSLTLTALVCLITSCFWAALAGPQGPPPAKSSTTGNDADELPIVPVLTLATERLEAGIVRRGVVEPSAQVKIVAESTARIPIGGRRWLVTARVRPLCSAKTSVRCPQNPASHGSDHVRPPSEDSAMCTLTP